MVRMNEYLSANVFQSLAHRHTQRLWKESQKRTGDGETAGCSSRSTKRGYSEEKTREDWSEWHTAKGRAEGWALFTHPQAAALTLLGDRIQAPGMCVYCSLLAEGCFCCIFPQQYP